MARKQIDFSSKINIIASHVNPEVQLNNRAVKLVSSILNSLNKKLSDKYRERVSVNLGVTAAMDVVNQACTGRMKHHALAEGNRILCLYNNKMVHYTPVVAPRPRRVKQVKEATGKMFIKELSGIVREIFPDAKLKPNAKQFLSTVLEKLMEKMSEEAKTFAAEKKIIGPEDLQRAMESILPNELRIHALSEGPRMIQQFQTGMIRLRPMK